MNERTNHTRQDPSMSALSPDQQQLLGNLIAEAVAILRSRGRMTEVDALVSLQSTVALTTEALIGSREAAAALRALAGELEKRGLEPLRLPKKNT
ncbi:hypothetical protein QC756_09110 [Sinorhizobium meliloti]|uniref:hypothetical protein n=1 Tax=Rhizobium meliloti TaxID=382 RepID=UPI00244DD17C|nr:hypothetical protein [Sinorhizobium meliloti]WGI76007.1 hypothetical protein QC756_09110 [Sinorhizobium meliloti]